MPNFHRHLKCARCRGWYKEPRRLPDGHILCTRCIEKLPVENGMITCPKCNKPQQLPEKGVLDLDLDLNIVEMMEEEVKCQDCLNYDEEIQPCEQCRVNVCSQCSDLHGREDKCNFLQLLRDMTKPGGQIDATLTDHIEELHQECKDIIPEIEKAQRDLAHEIKQYQTKLEQLLDEKCQQLNDLMVDAQKRGDELKRALICSKFPKSAKTQIRLDDSEKRIKALAKEAKTIQKSMLNIEESLTSMDRKTLEETDALSLSLKRISGRMNARYAETESQTVPNGVDAATQKPHLYQISEDSMFVPTRMPEIKDTVLELEIDCIHDIAYCPYRKTLFVIGYTKDRDQASRDQEVINLYDERFQPTKQLRVLSCTDCSMCSIHVNKDGVLMRCRDGNIEIVGINRDHEVLDTINTNCSCAGITTDECGNIYVSDSRAGFVSKLDKNGNLLKMIGQGEIKSPASLAVFENKLFVSDQNRQVVLIMTTSGQVLHTIKMSNPKSHAGAVIIDEHEQILWTDIARNSIYVYTITGKYLYDICYREGLQDPRSMVSLPLGRVAVISQGNDKIIVF